MCDADQSLTFPATPRFADKLGDGRLYNELRNLHVCEDGTGV